MSDRNPIGQAIEHVEITRTLLASEGWEWFAGELSKDMAGLTRQVMEDELTQAERDNCIARYRALKSALERPGSVLDGAQSVLSQQATPINEEQSELP